MKLPDSTALPGTITGTTNVRTGWTSLGAAWSMAILLYELATGLAITLATFHPVVQYAVLAHTIIGALTLLPVSAYCVRHLADYRRHPASHITVLGWLTLAGWLVCSASGIVVTLEALLAVRTTPAWRAVHLVSTLVLLAGIASHVVFAAAKSWSSPGGAPTGIGRYAVATAAFAIPALVLTALLPRGSRVPGYSNQFPPDYSYLAGTNRPFAPSLARTDTGGAFDARSLAGSHTCGTAGCHDQIVEEWLPSAHRYSAMDSVFLAIQDVMAKQNGPESTRYCGGCHDPISLFSGTKNLFVENLTGLHGYQEGVSCLSCHAIRETDIKGNASYTVTQPREYLWQWETNGPTRLLRDFLIRSYPAEHGRLAKRSFKKPEYCAACHKQFIDAEVNRVGWVQLQNQYDNWAASHWNKKGDARRTVECRECHMPLVESHDPASGDALDYNRTPTDRRHRSHRFIAANTLMPVALRDRLTGADSQLQLTEQWLRGERPIPEIQDKWANGPIVSLAASAPTSVPADSPIPLQVVMTSNKVGHDFPTGPLDIIQSWLDISVTDDHGQLVWSSGKRDAKHFLQPGTFLFKAEPVDQHGNLIDRHNLWEMVGVRFRRALFPGHSDSVQFSIDCAGSLSSATNRAPNPIPDPARAATPNTVTNDTGGALLVPTPDIPALARAGDYRIDVALNYRKVDQFLLNFIFGETNRLTAPVTQLTRTSLVVRVERPNPKRAGLPPLNPASPGLLVSSPTR